MSDAEYWPEGELPPVELTDKERREWADLLKVRPIETWGRTEEIRRLFHGAAPSNLIASEVRQAEGDWATWRRAVAAVRCRSTARADREAYDRLMLVVLEKAPAVARRRHVDLGWVERVFRHEIEALLEDDSPYDVTSMSLAGHIHFKLTDAWHKVRDQANAGGLHDLAVELRNSPPDWRPEYFEDYSVRDREDVETGFLDEHLDLNAVALRGPQGIEESVDWSLAPGALSDMLNGIMADETALDWMLKLGFATAGELDALNADLDRLLEDSEAVVSDDALKVLGIGPAETRRKRIRSISARVVLAGRLCDLAAQSNRKPEDSLKRVVELAQGGQWLSPGQSELLDSQVAWREGDAHTWLKEGDVTYGCDYKYQFAAENMNAFLTWAASRELLEEMAHHVKIATADIGRHGSSGTRPGRRTGLANTKLAALVAGGSGALRRAASRPWWHPFEKPRRESDPPNVSSLEESRQLDEKCWVTSVRDAGRLLDIERAIWTAGTRASLASEMVGPGSSEYLRGVELLTESGTGPSDIHVRLRHAVSRRVCSLYWKDPQGFRWLLWEGKESVKRIAAIREVAMREYDSDEDRMIELALTALDRRLGIAGLKFLLVTLVDYEHKGRE